MDSFHEYFPNMITLLRQQEEIMLYGNVLNSKPERMKGLVYLNSRKNYVNVIYCCSAYAVSGGTKKRAVISDPPFKGVIDEAAHVVCRTLPALCSGHCTKPFVTYFSYYYDR